MKFLLECFLFLAILIVPDTLCAQVAPSIEWQKCYGGITEEMAFSIQPTTDGGFIISGDAYSTDGDLTENNGQQDYWIVKIDSVGGIEWQTDLGGSNNENAYWIEQTFDGGYIAAGFTLSTDSDVTGNHSNNYDYWIVRLYADGEVAWKKCLGGSGVEIPYMIQQTTDSGFIVAGLTALSSDGDVSGNHGIYDYWIVKLDTAGGVVWQKCLGGTNQEVAYSIQQTSDDGFIIAGETKSNNGDVSNNHGGEDYWIVKLDADGNLLWQKTLGGSNYERAYSIEQTTDGGFIVGGYSTSNDGDVSGNHGSSDYWIVKLDTAGNLEWQKSLGGTGSEIVRSIHQTPDGEFIAVGHTSSIDEDVLGNHGQEDFWIIKLDTGGNLIWQKCLGGVYNDIGYCIRQTQDGGLIVSGSASSNDGDVSGNHGDSDFWIVKLSNDIPTVIPFSSKTFISLSPNPVQNLLTIDLAAKAANSTIRVYDLQGRIIALPRAFTNTQVQLNTATIPDGFYTLHIINNKTGESEVEKFVKQL